MSLKKIISFPYQLVHEFRSSLYRSGILKRKKLPAYTISIGNLSFGGTGKTPVTIELARHFAKLGYKVAVLKRPYKAKKEFKEPLLIDCNQPPEGIGAEDIGDEAMEMLKSFKRENLNIVLALGKDRYQAGLEALGVFTCDLLILDDGLQYIELGCDTNIVLKNLQEDGFYREFPSNEKRADYVLLTKADGESHSLGENSSGFHVEFNQSLTKNLDTKRGIGVFTGIASPKSFINMLLKTLEKQGILTKANQLIRRIFPDHHFFSIDEVTEVLALGINIIVTPKDLVKIPEEYRERFIVANLSVKLPKAFLDDITADVTAKLSKAKGEVYF